MNWITCCKINEIYGFQGKLSLGIAAGKDA
jgi:hypothetical protein